MKGHINKLAVHAVGARVIELLFNNFPAKATASLKLELYGPQFALFTSGDLSLSNSVSTPTLQSILKDQPDKKEVAMKHVFNVLNKGIEKSLFSFAYFQQLLSEYILAATANEIRSISSSISDHAIHLLSTRQGARVVAECATYSTPKDRKKMLKSLKGYTRSSLLHSDAYIALLRLVDVTDDTVSVQKLILEELRVDPDAGKLKVSVDGTIEDDGEGRSKSSILDVALSDTGSKMFLLLLSQDDEKRRKYFDPLELEILKANPTIIENGAQIPTSKKNPSTRRLELLQYMKSDLIELCNNHTDELLRTWPGSKILREVFDTYPSKELAESIVNVCKNTNAEKDDDDSKDISIFEHPVAHLAIKHLLLADIDREDECIFANSLHNAYKGDLMNIASSNRGALILSAMAKVVQLKNDVDSELQSHLRAIRKLARGDKSGKKQTGGYKALLDVLESKK